MKKISALLLDFLTYIGSLIFVSAFILALVVAEKQHTMIIDLLPVFAVILGIMTLVFTLAVSHKAYHFFMGLFLMVAGSFVFLLVRGYLQHTIYQWWPFLGIAVGLILFVTGIYKYRRITVGFAIPALTIFLMGCWFMLFSFKIVKVPFSQVALIGGPLFMIFVMVFLFAFFLLQQKNKNLVIEDDEPDSFEDD
ncbi:MAG: hypothetical protein J5527_06555 [Treponema sp.]|nr:hypothetical protein [Treponema sp.]